MFFALIVGARDRGLSAESGADGHREVPPQARRRCRRLRGITGSRPTPFSFTAGSCIGSRGRYLSDSSKPFVHWLIDFGKCEKWFGIHVDQGLHVACKVLWCVLIWQGVAADLDARWPMFMRHPLANDFGSARATPCRPTGTRPRCGHAATQNVSAPSGTSPWHRSQFTALRATAAIRWPAPPSRATI